MSDNLWENGRAGFAMRRHVDELEKELRASIEARSAVDASILSLIRELQSTKSDQNPYSDGRGLTPRRIDAKPDVDPECAEILRRAEKDYYASAIRQFSDLGKGRSEIAAILCVEETLIKEIMLERKIVLRRDRKNIDRNDLESLVKDGYSIAQIAECLNVSIPTIRNRMGRFDIKIPRRKTQSSSAVPTKQSNPVYSDAYFSSMEIEAERSRKILNLAKLMGLTVETRPREAAS